MCTDYLCAVSNLNEQAIEKHETIRCAYSTRGSMNISLLQYAQRIAVYSGMSASCWPMAMIYIRRMQEDASLPKVIILHRNLHRMLASVTLIATKFIDDAPFDNQTFADLYGVSLIELNHLELFTLDALKWKLNVPVPEFECMQKLLNIKAHAIMP